MAPTAGLNSECWAGGLGEEAGGGGAALAAAASSARGAGGEGGPLGPAEDVRVTDSSRHLSGRAAPVFLLSCLPSCLGSWVGSCLGSQFGRADGWEEKGASRSHLWWAPERSQSGRGGRALGSGKGGGGRSGRRRGRGQGWGRAAGTPGDGRGPRGGGGRGGRVGGQVCGGAQAWPRGPHPSGSAFPLDLECDPRRSLPLLTRAGQENHLVI